MQSKVQVPIDVPVIIKKPDCVLMTEYLQHFIQDWQKIDIDPHAGMIHLRWRSRFSPFIQLLETQQLQEHAHIVRLYIASLQPPWLQITMESECV